MPGTASLDLSGSTIKAQRFARPDILAVGGSNSIEGGLLEWVKSTLYPDEKQGEELFDTMEAEARESSLGAGGVVFLPYLLGERAPFDDPDARGMFFGLERKHGREDLVRAVFESIGFLTRHMVSEIERSNATVETLEAAGGLTRRNFACQIKADVTGKPVLLVEELENTALGCMIITASQAREEDMQSIANEVVDYSRRFEPDPDRHEKYSELYDLFRELYESNKENFKRRADLIERLDEDETGSDRQL
nr:FGGY-family carbohydrate kinase [Halovenus carboxidivorans]